MTPGPMGDPDVTHLIRELEGGDRTAFDRLLAAIYPVLREMARAQRRDQRAGHTLDATALVHEAYLRMVRYRDVSWQGRAHFFGSAAKTMRRVLVDHARARSADKRRGEHVTLATGIANEDVALDRVLEIENALERLEVERPRWARVVECRYFAGLTLEETAEALGISHATVSNDWRLARAWLRQELGG